MLYHKIGLENLEKEAREERLVWDFRLELTLRKNYYTFPEFLRNVTLMIYVMDNSSDVGSINTNNNNFFIAQ